MRKPKWKTMIEQKIENANKMAEEFRNMGISCTVNEAGEICMTGADMENYKPQNEAERG